MSLTEPSSSLLALRAEKLAYTFQLLPDNEERLRYLITLGRRYPALDPVHRLEANLLSGCISQLWIYAEIREGLCFFQMDADALISKGMAALLCEFYNAAPPYAVATYEPNFLISTGLTSLISPSRQSGLGSLRQTIRSFAMNNLSQTIA